MRTARLLRPLAGTLYFISSKYRGRQQAGRGPDTDDISSLFDKKFSAMSTQLLTNIKSTIASEVKEMISTEINTAIGQLKNEFTCTTDYLT
ncbi:hypothetical protein K1T71_012965 [Dendrolimus kikuchii]|uniref:Uncharacterized protein n=1 Tax=Dendrolimus kikuchii TaxID=765133 RepID=A0ACC1CIQ6_9NEOP|nr:hypothetical protein K1T71_012965 [Dendrolimus kikuchii]